MEDEDNDNQYCTSFDNINLKEYTLRGIYAYGWEKPSDIQKQSLIKIITICFHFAIPKTAYPVAQSLKQVSNLSCFF